MPCHVALCGEIQETSRNTKKHQEPSRTSRNIKKHQETSRNTKKHQKHQKHQETSRNIKKHWGRSRHRMTMQGTWKEIMAEVKAGQWQVPGSIVAIWCNLLHPELPRWDEVIGACAFPWRFKAILTSVVSSRRKQQLETSLLGHSIVWSGHVKKCQGAGKCTCYSIELILVFEVECHLT